MTIVPRWRHQSMLQIRHIPQPLCIPSIILHLRQATATNHLNIHHHQLATPTALQLATHITLQLATPTALLLLPQSPPATLPLTANHPATHHHRTIKAISPQHIISTTKYRPTFQIALCIKHWDTLQAMAPMVHIPQTVSICFGVKSFTFLTIYQGGSVVIKIQCFLLDLWLWGEVFFFHALATMPFQYKNQEFGTSLPDIRLH